MKALRLLRQFLITFLGFDEDLTQYKNFNQTPDTVSANLIEKHVRVLHHTNELPQKKNRSSRGPKKLRYMHIGHVT